MQGKISLHDRKTFIFTIFTVRKGEQAVKFVPGGPNSAACLAISAFITYNCYIWKYNALTAQI